MIDEKWLMKDNGEILVGLIKQIDEFGKGTDRDNANVGNNFSAKLLRIASESNKIANLSKMPEKMRRLHEEGYLHYHDLDSFNLSVNCLHLGLKDLLDRGFNTGYGTLRKPKSITSASSLMCIAIQSVQNDQYGGVSITDFENDLASYYNPEIDTPYMIRNAMQGIVYNLNTMHCRAGSQVPFSSLNIGLPRSPLAGDLCRIFLEEYNKGLGNGEPAIFPNIIFRTKTGVNANPEDKWYGLYKLACEVASKRMNPTFLNLDCSFNLKNYNEGHIPATMGCRTRVQEDINGIDDGTNRGNIAPCTINLPRLAMENTNIESFKKALDDMIENAKNNLLYRYGVLKELKVKDLPFIVGQGIWVGSEGLKEEDSIEPILRHGTYGIGFIGLAEAMQILFGRHHGEDDNVYKFAYNVVKRIREKCNEYKQQYKLNFSCYATPGEGTCYRFVKLDRKYFGIVKGINDKDYYTNSFHIPVSYSIPILRKLDLEAPFHELCNGGHITYIEIDNYPTPDMIMKIVDYWRTKTNGSYLGINFHIRYCKHCYEMVSGYVATCPKCGGKEFQGISRVTGYLSLDERFGIGKTAERNDRSSATVKHFYQNKYIGKYENTNK